MSSFTYDVEVRGIGLTASVDSPNLGSLVRIANAAVRFDTSTTPIGLSIATHDVARVVETFSRSIEDAQGPLPFAYVDSSTDIEAVKLAYEESFLLVEFFEHGLRAARFAHEHIVEDRGVRDRVEDLIVELEHAFVVGARAYEKIREAVEEYVSLESFSPHDLE